MSDADANLSRYHRSLNARRLSLLCIVSPVALVAGLALVRLLVNLVMDGN